jgi:hypothetical protein
MTDKQQAFINFYLGEAKLNATMAARLAGYADPEMEGWRVRQDPEVQAEIKGRIAEYAMGADEVLAGLTEIAKGDIGDFIEGGIYLKPAIVTVKKDRVLNTRLIKKITVSDTSVSLEMYSRLDALTALGKALGMFVDRHRIDGELGLRHEYDLKKLSDEELEQLEQLVGKTAGAGADPGGEGTAETGADLDPI